jgi:hypothetical protein
MMDLYEFGKCEFVDFSTAHNQYNINTARSASFWTPKKHEAISRLEKITGISLLKAE